ncbi:MAG TPA: Hsp20/alpha crystallin family protein [Alphaproteobacteria bacterium]|nr:Hsp20/alpha crystallin family protein [Alphaproteobacteria bacterium]
MANAPVQINRTAPARAGAFEPWQSFRKEMDRLFDRFSTTRFPSAFEVPSFGRFFGMEPELTLPAVDVNEDDKAFTVMAELPGLEEKDVEVTVSGDMLVIKGEKKLEKEEKNKNFYLSERSFGAFQRAFALPKGVDQAKIAASFGKGVLTVTLPKSAETQKQQKKIEVKAA